MPLGDLLDILVLLNSSINFFLYCCMSSQFRHKFKTVFLCFKASVLESRNQLSLRRTATNNPVMMPQGEKRAVENVLKDKKIEKTEESVHLIMNAEDVDNFPVMMKHTTSSYEFIDI